MGAPPGLIPEGYDGQLSYSIQLYLRKLKKQVGNFVCMYKFRTYCLPQAKIDSDRYVSSVVKHKNTNEKQRTM